jgi:uncharacterized protein
MILVNGELMALMMICAAVCTMLGAMWALWVVLQRRALFGKPKVPVIPETATHRISSITLPVDGDILHGWLAIPNTAVRGAIVDSNGREESPTTLLTLLPHVPGQAMLVLHRRGLGPSGGRPSERAHVRDGLLALDWLCGHLEISLAAVTVIGRSLGSGVAVRVAAQRQIGRLVLISPFDRLVNVIRHRYPRLPEFALRDKFDSVRHMPAVNCPCQVVVGEQDQVIPAVFSRALFANWPGSVKWFSLADGQHRGLLRNPAVLAAIAEFVQRDYAGHASLNKEEIDTAVPLVRTLEANLVA